MGMYTEFHFNVELENDVPEDVIEVLRFMTADRDKPEKLPDHPLFSTARWSFMLRCSSYYFPHSSGTRFYEDEVYAGCWFLNVRCSFKNYNDEIEKFLNWVAPYVAEWNDDFAGFYRYEESDHPTLIYMSDYLEYA